MVQYAIYGSTKTQWFNMLSTVDSTNTQRFNSAIYRRRHVGTLRVSVDSILNPCVSAIYHTCLCFLPKTKCLKNNVFVSSIDDCTFDR